MTFTKEQFWEMCHEQKYGDAQWTLREQVWAQIEEERAALRQQVVAYRERLEIGFAFDAITGERIERPEEELGTALDGIACRDEYIRGQDERLADLKAQLAQAQGRGA